MNKKYSPNFMKWANYFAGIVGATFDDEGLKQFFDYETHGIKPASPTPYFHRLNGGRNMYNALQKEVRETYGTDRWQGIAHDQETMPEWLFRSFYGWHHSVRKSA